MRALVPEAAATVNVHEHYARGWLDTGGVRVNMVSSLDGAGSAGGLSAGLQTPGDNVVFAALRDLADVVLAGSGTVRAEDYGPVTFSEERASLRRDFGLRPALPVAVLSRSLDLDVNSRLFGDGRPDRPIVFTTARGDAERRAAVGRVAEVVSAGDDDIDPGRVRRELAARGLTRVLCEGGPTILARFAGAGEVDELCVSLSPMLAGPGAARIVAGAGWDGDPMRYALTGVLAEDGALFLRYAAVRG